jgi:hypothetical protein
MGLARPILALALAAMTVTTLSGCIFAGAVLEEATQFGPVNDRPVVDGPAGWEEFVSCEGGPRDDFIWIDGIPSDELDAVGIRPDCGDTWIESDGDHFMNVTDYSVTEAELDALDAALTAAGWERKWDDFVPAEEGSAPAGVGARDYYREGDTVKFAIEIYSNPTAPVSYTAYLDYHSPATRALS